MADRLHDHGCPNKVSMKKKKRKEKRLRMMGEGRDIYMFGEGANGR